MIEGKDPYAILGVSPDSEDVVIQAAYRALMRRYHPDANPSAAAAERTKEINAAYAVLGNPTSRAEYDSGHRRNDEAAEDSAGSAPPPEPPDETFYDNDAGNDSAARRRAKSPGAILAYVVIVLFSAGVGIAAVQNSIHKNASSDSSSNTMSVDENLTTTDMNAASGDASGYDINAVDTNAASAVAVAPPADLSTQTQPPVDYSTIERAAQRFSSILLSHGMIGARDFSEHCHRATREKPTWDAADSCAAFDYAAAYIDDSVSRGNNMPANGYFQFQRDNQGDNYSAAGAASYTFYNRLPQIKRAAESEAAQDLQAELARQRARNTSSESPETSSTNDVGTQN